MRIVHLSDIHLENTKSNIKDCELYMESLIKDLTDFNKSKNIDLIVFTGDLINKGGEKFENPKTAFEEFEKLIINPILEMGIEKERIFFCPGNHDIIPAEDSPEIESGFTSRLENTESVNEIIDRDTEEGVKRVLPYKNFESKFVKNCKYVDKEITNFQSSFILEIDKKKIGINCLNSAWRCYDSKTDMKKIILGERQITDGTKFIKTCDIKIALMHHQIDWLKDFDQKDIERYLNESSYDIAFSGHVHSGSMWKTSTPNSEYFISVAPSNGIGNLRNDSRDYSNGYTIIDYSEREVITYSRRYKRGKVGFIENSDIGDNGVAHFPINKKKNEFDSELNISFKTEEKNRYYGNIDIVQSNNEIISNIHIKNNMDYSIFYKSIEKYRKMFMEISSRSISYGQLENKLDFITILADKILYKIKQICQCEEIITLEKIISNIDKEIKVIDLKEIYIIIEWWLSYIYKFIEDNLIEEDGSLNEILQCIINKISISNENDEFVNILIQVKETYRCVLEEDDYELNKKSNYLIRTQIIVAIIFPIYLNCDSIFNTISDIKIGEYENKEIQQSIKEVETFYNRLSKDCMEREGEINNTYKSFIKEKYTLLTGAIGVGKSSIVAGVISKMEQEKYKSKVIPYSFQFSKNIDEMVESIVINCNLRLINKIDESIFKDRKFDIENIKNYDKDRLFFYKKIFNEILIRFILEYKEIYLVLDSLELVEEVNIIDLFEETPIGVHLLVVSDNHHKLKDRLKDKLKDDGIINVDNITMKDIHLFTSIKDGELDKNGIEINKKIFEKSFGNIKIIKSLIGKSTTNSEEIDLEAFDYVESQVQQFEQQADKWIVAEENCLEETLLFLSVFQPINILNLEDIQSFLKNKNYSYRLPKIRNITNQVKDQIDTYSYNKIKLTNKDFSDYVLQKYFSKDDVELFIEDIFKWLTNKKQLKEDFFTDFVTRVSNPELIDENCLDKFIVRFIEVKKSENKDNQLYDVGLYLYFKNEKIKKIGMKFIEESSNMMNSDAKTFLGINLIENSEEISRGEKLLIEACELENIDAKMFLGNILLDGRSVRRDAEKGEKLLLEAVELGNENAKLILAERMVRGRGIKLNIHKGIDMLRELVDYNNVKAMIILANIMLNSSRMEKNIDEGKNLLIKASNLNSEEAKLNYALRLVYSDGVETDIKQGVKILDELIDKGNNKAKRALARIKLYGKGILKNIDEGIELLEKLVENNDSKALLLYSNILKNGYIIKKDEKRSVDLLEVGVKNDDAQCMEVLGERLLDGEGIEKDYERGIELINKSISKGNVQANIILANRYIDGIGVEKDTEKGIGILENLVKKGEIEAITQYAFRLVSGNPNDLEKQKGIKLIKIAMEQDEIDAKIFWAKMLVEGKIIDKNVIEGKKVLESLCDRGIAAAMRELGYRLLYGIGMKKDKIRGEELLIQSKDKGDVISKIIISEAVLSGYISNYKELEAITWLEESINEDKNAKRILGLLKIKGERVKQDKDNGERLLMDAIQDRDGISARILGNMLIDGSYLHEDKERGRKLLLRAIELGDDFALVCLAERLILGEGISKNKEKGKQIFEELIENKNCDALICYAKRLIEGKYIEQNIARAEMLLNLAINEGSIKAKRVLAMNIFENRIESKGKVEAVNILEENICNDDKMSMYLLGSILINGEHIDKDIDKGTNLLERAILLNCVEAKFKLAILLIEGELIKENRLRGMQLLQQLYEDGNQKSKFTMALYLIKGTFVTRNYKKGVEFLEELIEDGYKEAQLKLALILVKGYVERDYLRGVKLFEDLVAKKDYNAMRIYGELLLDGLCVDKDTKKGMELLLKAERNGDDESKHIIANRLLNGQGFSKHKSRAMKKYKRVSGKDLLAKFEFGLRLKFGKGLPISTEKGNKYIKYSKENANDNEKCSMGIIAYRLKCFDIASELFYEAYKNNVRTANVSLAYMVRRNEYKGVNQIPDVKEILETNLEANEYNAKINYALSFVRKNKKSDDKCWEIADDIFANLGYYNDSAEWWYDSIKEGDLEGELVVGWLGKYGLIKSLDSIPFQERFSKVDGNGWELPKWMYDNKKLYSDMEIALEKDIKNIYS